MNKSNKKGFTLIEMITVIVILSLLVLIIVPLVSTNLKKGNEKAYQAQINNIIASAKNWGINNKNLLPQDGNTISLTLKYLQDEGYIDKNLKDPRTGDTLNGCIDIQNKNGKQHYTFNDKCGTSCAIDAVLTPTTLKSKVVTEGDGLYVDSTKEGRFIYKGANPNNYITFNNELWRIISVENDGSLKIVKNDSIGDMILDPGENTSITGITARTSSYCKKDGSSLLYYGCKVWGSNTTMLDSSGNNITKMPREIGGATYDLPEKEAYLNTYLNNEYYNNLLEKSKSLIKNHTWNVGLLKRESGQTLQTDLAQESSYKWKGKIALINPTDYVKSNTNTELCGNVYANYGGNNNYETCRLTTWLYDDAHYYWTLSPDSSVNTGFAFYIYNTGSILVFNANQPAAVYPTLYLKSNINLCGEGTETSPYIIK